MVVVSYFTEKIPRSELGGLTWSTINDPPISHGAIGEVYDAQKVENGRVALSVLVGKSGRTCSMLVNIIFREKNYAIIIAIWIWYFKE